MYLLMGTHFIIIDEERIYRLQTLPFYFAASHQSGWNRFRRTLLTRTSPDRKYLTTMALAEVAGTLKH
jgi:hypothetical protein